MCEFLHINIDFPQKGKNESKWIKTFNRVGWNMNNVTF